MTRGTRAPMRWARGILLALVGAVLLPLTVGAGWAALERGRDPILGIQRPPVEVSVLRDSAYAAWTAAGEPRLFRDLVLETAAGGTVRITTSRPAVDPDSPMPLVVVLGGLRTGRESLTFVDEHGPNVLVGYEYPYSRETFYERAPLRQVPDIRRAVLDVPGQVANATAFLLRDPAVDTGRVSLLGYSFGALFVPAVQRVAMDRERPFHAMIMAFGGAGLGELLDANLRVRPKLLRRGLAATGATLLHPVEPAHHLPHLAGRFLLVRGEYDRQVPTVLAERMAELTPEPKEVVVLESGHMGPGDPELSARVVAISQEWLVRHGMIEPPGS